jgi:hypothetical protein
MIVSLSSGLALDGNTAVPQQHPSHPQPFFWQPTPSAPNHRWRFVPIAGQNNVFGIVCSANNMALDANVSAITHSGAHPAPFMWQFVPNAPNHQWRLNFVWESQNVSIVSASSGLALDANTGACAQISGQHPRPFLWAHTPSAANHRWQLRHVQGDEYMIVSQSSGLALDGNTAVPQQDAAHPKPFMWQPTPTAPNHRWRLVPTGAPNCWMIVNVANGLALDANVSATMHTSPQHPCPFLWQPVPTAPNHQWHLYY